MKKGTLLLLIILPLLYISQLIASPVECFKIDGKETITMADKRISGFKKAEIQAEATGGQLSNSVWEELTLVQEDAELGYGNNKKGISSGENMNNGGKGTLKLPFAATLNTGILTKIRQDCDANRRVKFRLTGNDGIVYTTLPALASFSDTHGGKTEDAKIYLIESQRGGCSAITDWYTQA